MGDNLLGMRVTEIPDDVMLWLIATQCERFASGLSYEESFWGHSVCVLTALRDAVIYPSTDLSFVVSSQIAKRS